MTQSNKIKVAIIGGGASGVFAAIRAASVAKANNVDIEICIFETSSRPLKKVKISGGGRCNVTHNIFDIRAFCENYPRGQKELMSAFNVFQAEDMVNWFKDRGVSLKTESDGRMFPITDKSQTIIDCFLNELNKHNIKLLTRQNVKSIVKSEQGFSLTINDKEFYIADKVLVATGSMPAGYSAITVHL